MATGQLSAALKHMHAATMCACPVQSTHSEIRRCETFCEYASELAATCYHHKSHAAICMELFTAPFSCHPCVRPRQQRSQHTARQRSSASAPFRYAPKATRRPSNPTQHFTRGRLQVMSGSLVEEPTGRGAGQGELQVYLGCVLGPQGSHTRDRCKGVTIQVC